MNIQAEKLFLIEVLARIEDVDVIRQVKQLLTQNDPIIGYELNGNSITRKQLIARIEAAEDRIDNGQFITQEALE